MKDHGPVTILDVLDEDELACALRCISHRKGSPGIDGVKGDMLPEYWEKNEGEIKKRLLHGTYRPKPVVAIKIPKPDSRENRRIEIPCTVDRMLQTAMLGVLSPCFEPSFLPSSYAFRKMGGCHKALEACLRELRSGASWIIDLDIRHFFDKVDHGILLSIIRRTIKDKRLLLLIGAYVSVDVMNGGAIYKKRRGLSQGGPLSPLLANVYLNELDLFLYRIGAHSVRYADDMLLFCRTQEEAQKLLQHVEDYLRDYLHLSLNEEKTKIARPWEIRFLGHSFIQEDEDDPRSYVLTLGTKTETRMLQKMKRNIRRSLPGKKSRKKSNHHPVLLWERLGGFNRGWIQYFHKVRGASMTHFLQEAEQFQVAFLAKELHKMRKNNRDSLLSALYECRSFSTLTGWYMLRYPQKDADAERNLELTMSNKYCFWRSGSFYPFRTPLYKAWSTYSSTPFYMMETHDEQTRGCCVVKHRISHSRTPFPELTGTELHALGILAAGKSMTENQLTAFLKMKAVNLTVSETRTMLEKFAAESLVEKVCLYPAPQSRRSCIPQPEQPENKEAPIIPMTAWRVAGRGKRALRKIAAPVDNRIFSFGKENSGKAERDLQIARFYMDTILFNQIILQYMLSCSGFRFFEICTGYNMGEHTKAYVPLYIETEEGNWLFWHLYSDSSRAFHFALHNWELFCRRRRPCTLVLLATSDIVKHMTAQRLRALQEKIAPDSSDTSCADPPASKICLFEAAAWFSPTSAGKSGLPLLLSLDPKPLRSCPEDCSAPIITKPLRSSHKD